MGELLFEKLSKYPSFTAADAKKFNISTSVLAYYVKIGMIERIVPGVYRNPQAENTAPFEWQDLIEIAQSIPEGIVCLISALAYYDLTQEIPRQHWIAVPNESKGMKRPNTKILRMRNTSLGKTKIKIGKYKITIFNQERSVIDSFRYLSKESAIYSLKAYLTKTNKPDLSKLARYAKKLRVHIVPYLEALT